MPNQSVCDWHEFFRHENQSFAAVLSDNGKLHTCQKSQLATILEVQIKIPDKEPEADAIIIDGSALVNTLPPQSSKTFEDYAMLDVLPTIYPYSSKYPRTDIVYLASSLKAETRSKRGSGARRKVTANVKVPQNWRSFLRDNDNKTELFHFLADKISEIETLNTVIVTRGEYDVSNQAVNLDAVAPCSHEEADTRLFVHAHLMIVANDTDVLAIAVSTLPTLQDLGIQQL
jgi:hypothetical protein